MEYVGLKPYDRVTAFGGVFIANIQFDKDPDYLLPLPEITKEKHNQQQAFKSAVSHSKLSIGLNITGSNDLKFFIVNPEGYVMPLRDGASDIWDTLSWEKKAYYQPRHRCLVPAETYWFIEARVRDYMETLIAIYKNSGFKLVYLSSILERKYKRGPLVNAEIYIALINYFICRYLRKLEKESILNKLNQPIKFEFINVSSQFHKADNKESLFSKNDVAAGQLIHRKKEAWRELMRLYLNKIREN